VRHVNKERCLTKPRALPTKGITPLWIIALFVSLTETVLGVAVFQTQGVVQATLTAFVICFPLMIAGIFFFILWHRPYVLYPPTDFRSGSADVLSYVNAMRAQSETQPDLLQSISETIRSTIVSEDVLSSLSTSLLRDPHAEISQVLDAAASKAAHAIGEENFVTVDTRPLVGADGRVWPVALVNFGSLLDLLDHIWFEIGDYVPAYTYGFKWVLEDALNHKVLFPEAGLATGGLGYTSEAFILAAQYLPLEKAGIHPGMSLLVVPLGDRSG
jgi:hypothetical protein